MATNEEKVAKPTHDARQVYYDLFADAISASMKCMIMGDFEGAFQAFQAQYHMIRPYVRLGKQTERIETLLEKVQDKIGRVGLLAFRTPAHQRARQGQVNEIKKNLAEIQRLLREVGRDVQLPTSHGDVEFFDEAKLLEGSGL